MAIESLLSFLQGFFLIPIVVGGSKEEIRRGIIMLTTIRQRRPVPRVDQVFPLPKVEENCRRAGRKRTAAARMLRLPIVASSPKL